LTRELEKNEITNSESHCETEKENLARRKVIWSSQYRYYAFLAMASKPLSIPALIAQTKRQSEESANLTATKTTLSLSPLLLEMS
jgi:hypothetical protein